MAVLTQLRISTLKSTKSIYQVSSNCGLMGGRGGGGDKPHEDNANYNRKFFISKCLRVLYSKAMRLNVR